MTRNDKNTQITELDFNKIKGNFREFLKSQDEYSDFDLEASGMDVILDILAYNTFYNAFYLNTAVNESYLSTSSKRQNIVKRAESLNYVPKSYIGAINNVDVQIVIPLNTLISIFGGTDYGIVQLEKHNRFRTTIDNQTYTFVNENATPLTQIDDTTFFVRNLRIKQGVPNTFRYTVDSSDKYQRFIIPEEKVDISSLSIFSQSPQLAETTRYVFHKEVQLDQIDQNTPVYFLRENGSGQYEVFFGDGVFGYKPIDGEQIFIEYLVTEGPLANGTRSFSSSNTISISGNIVNDATVTANTNIRSFGGAEKETDESVVFNAPRFFQTQDRAVVNNDFSSLIRSQFQNVESVNVWGGEQNIPPQYGRVFIAIKPFGSNFFTDSEKTFINDYIREKMVGSIRPIIVDPKYTFIRVSHSLKFDSKRTLKSQSDIRGEVIKRTTFFSKTRLEKFRQDFFLSQLVENVTDIDESIESVESKVEMVKRFTPQLNIATSYTLYFQNRILYPYRGFRASITSSSFTLQNNENCTFEQNESGSLSIVSTVGGVRRTLVEDAGDVDYTNGVVVLKAFSPQAFSGSFFRLFVVPDTNDIRSEREFIMKIEESDVIVNIVDITNISSITNGLNTRISGSSTTVDVSSTSF